MKKVIFSVIALVSVCVSCTDTTNNSSEKYVLDTDNLEIFNSEDIHITRLCKSVNKDFRVYLIDMKVNRNNHVGERHEYVYFQGGIGSYSHAGMTHLPDCKYCICDTLNNDIYPYGNPEGNPDGF